MNRCYYHRIQLALLLIAGAFLRTILPAFAILILLPSRMVCASHLAVPDLLTVAV